MTDQENQRLERLTNAVLGMREDMQALTTGLGLMLEAVQAQTGSLDALLAASTQEPDDNALPGLLRQLTAAVQANGAEVRRLSSMVAGAVIRGVGDPPA